VTYKVIFRKSAEKEYEALSDGERKAITQELKKLRITNRPRGSVELTGYAPLRRIKAGGVRAIYDEPDSKNRIFVLRIGTNHDVYSELDLLLPTPKRTHKK
jgi:mRNA-degrading endonuclease RelE of RelBE toxin-antitoxin system